MISDKEKKNDILIELPQFIDLWDTDIDEDVIYHLLDHESSPLFQLLVNNRGNTKLNEGILVLLRFLNRIPISEDSRFHMNHKSIDQLIGKQRIMKQFFSANASKRSLRRVMAFIEQNDGAVAFDSTKQANIITELNATFAIEDSLLFIYLLLDSASVWPHLRFENSLTSLEMLCMTWTYKCNDIFDSCFQLLKDYWTR